MGTKLLILDGQSLLNLLTHYTDGAIDLDARLLSVSVSSALQRYLKLEVESSQWKDAFKPGTDEYEPLHIRYEGNRVLKWGRNDQEMKWGREGKDFERPKFKA